MSCRFIHCNKCTAMVEDVIIGENSACVGVRMYWKSLYFNLTFAMKAGALRSQLFMNFFLRLLTLRRLWFLAPVP